jgi:DNA modification methylase
VFDEYGAGGDQDGKSEEDQVDEIAGEKKHISVLGDVWQLGDHRLVCGDSTAKETLAALLAIPGEQTMEVAQMTFTDPPYNVDYGNHGNKKWGKHEKIANDKMDAGAWSGFVTAFLERIRENTAGAVYICMSCKEWPSLQAAFIAAGFHWSTTVLWIKDRFTLGRSDYQRQSEPILVGKVGKVRTAKAEPILYGWPGGVDRRWNGGRDEGDAWVFTRPSRNPIHPTQKPVELVAKAIANSSNRGDIVLDLFGGGGSTLIACERTGRRARISELAPGYVDAMIARYVGHTKNAELVRNGKPFTWNGPVITIEGVLDSLG